MNTLLGNEISSDGESLERNSASQEPENGKLEAARATRLLKRARTLTNKGDFDRALDIINEAVVIAPKSPACYVHLAALYRTKNLVTNVILALKKAIELAPSNIHLQEQLLQSYLEAGMYDETIALGRKVARRAPKNMFARDVLGIAYLHQGRLDKALEVTNELIRLAPTDPVHHFKKAVLLQQKGEVSPAMAEFSRSLEMDPDGEMADDAREAMAALDSFQLRQILTIAIEDVVFRTKLGLDPENASQERGFHLSSAGVSALRQINLESLPGDAVNVYYN